MNLSRALRVCLVVAALGAVAAGASGGRAATLALTRAVADTGVDAAFFVFRDRTGDAVLPWSIIDGGMKASFLRSEYDKAIREEWTLPPKRQHENAKLLPVIQ